MDLRWMEDFLNLAQTRSFSRTAEERGISQPALSRRIQSLEAWVGTALVDRSVYPARLTAAGKLFQEQGADFVRHLQDTRAILREKEGLGSSALKIAAGYSLTLDFVPHWLAEMQQRLGPINARMIASNVHDSVLQLVEGGCDLLISYHHPEFPIVLDPGRYEFVALGHETILPVSAPGPGGAALHRLPGRRAQPTPWLAYTDASYLGRVVHRIFAQSPQPCHLQRRHESDLSELLKTLALQAVGLAWVPQRSVVHELERGQLVTTGGSAWSIALEIRLYRARANAHPTAQRLWQALGAQA